MKLKRIAALLLSLALVMACTACSAKPKTAAEVMEKMTAALDETAPSKYEINLGMDAELTLGSYGSMAFAITSLVDTAQSADPYAAHSVMNTEISYGESTEPTASSIETYSVVEDGTVVAYTTADGGSVWSRSETGMTEEDAVSAGKFISFNEASLAIDDSVTEYNGEKVICLTATMTGEELQSALAAASEEYAAVFEGVDLTPISCEVRIYVNDTTYLPVAESLNISGMSEVLTSLIASILGDGMTVEVSACTLSIVFNSYDAPEAITVPQTVLDSAVELAVPAADGEGESTETSAAGASAAQ